MKITFGELIVGMMLSFFIGFLAGGNFVGQNWHERLIENNLAEYKLTGDKFHPAKELVLITNRINAAQTNKIHEKR